MVLRWHQWSEAIAAPATPAAPTWILRSTNPLRPLAWTLGNRILTTLTQAKDDSYLFSSELIQGSLAPTSELTFKCTQGSEQLVVEPSVHSTPQWVSVLCQLRHFILEMLKTFLVVQFNERSSISLMSLRYMYLIVWIIVWIIVWNYYTSVQCEGLSGCFT